MKNALVILVILLSIGFIANAQTKENEKFQVKEIKVIAPSVIDSVFVVSTMLRELIASNKIEISENGETLLVVFGYQGFRDAYIVDGARELFISTRALNKKAASTTTGYNVYKSQYWQDLKDVIVKNAKDFVYQKKVNN